MIRSIIFDFDGVLVDSEILVARAFSRYMIESGYDFFASQYCLITGVSPFILVSGFIDITPDCYHFL